jgi:hypothetical protein
MVLPFRREYRVATLLAMTVWRMFVFHHSRHAERGSGNTRDNVMITAASRSPR